MNGKPGAIFDYSVDNGRIPRKARNILPFDISIVVQIKDTASAWDSQSALDLIAPYKKLRFARRTLRWNERSSTNFNIFEST